MIPTFNFLAEDLAADDLRRSLLLMEVGENYFSYLFFDREGSSLKALRRYRRTGEADRPGDAGWLEEIIASDDLLKETPAEVATVYNYRESNLMPEQYYHSDLNRPLLELVYGNSRKGLVLSEKIHGWQVYNVYQIPRAVHGLLQKKFAAGKYWHRYSLLLQCLEGRNWEGPLALILFYDDSYCLAIFRDRDLLLLQTYPYEAPEDVSYYLLAVCRQFGWSQEELLIRFAGLIDIDSAMYRELLKYFGRVEEATQSREPDAALLTSEYPVHYFSPMLDLIPCV